MIWAKSDDMLTPDSTEDSVDHICVKLGNGSTSSSNASQYQQWPDVEDLAWEATSISDDTDHSRVARRISTTDAVPFRPIPKEVDQEAIL